MIIRFVSSCTAIRSAAGQQFIFFGSTAHTLHTDMGAAAATFAERQVQTSVASSITGSIRSGDTCHSKPRCPTVVIPRVDCPTIARNRLRRTLGSAGQHRRTRTRRTELSPSLVSSRVPPATASEGRLVLMGRRRHGLQPLDWMDRPTREVIRRCELARPARLSTSM
jgi:hypothetical protein